MQTPSPTRPSSSTFAWASAANIVKGQGTGTILDDDTLPGLTINDVARPGGKRRSHDLLRLHPLSRTRPLKPVSVNLGTVEGTARSGDDFYPLGTMVTFAPGEQSRILSIAVPGDLFDEPDEVFYVRLWDAQGATILDGLGEGRILDDDSGPVVSIEEAAVIEGDSGSGMATAFFTVALSEPAAAVVVVDYATADGRPSPATTTSPSSARSFSSPASSFRRRHGSGLRRRSHRARRKLLPQSGAPRRHHRPRPLPKAGFSTTIPKSASATWHAEGDDGFTPLQFTLRLSAPCDVPVSVRSTG